MALLFCDGFDIDHPNDDPGIWDNAVVAPANALRYVSDQFRTGAGAAYFYGSTSFAYAQLRKTLDQDYAQLTVGMGIRIATGTLNGAYGNAIGLIAFRNLAGTIQIEIAIDETTGALGIWRGTIQTGTKIATGSTPIPRDTWHYLEARVDFDTAGGTATIRLNGTVEATYSGATADANDNGRIVDIGIIQHGSYGGQITYWADDLIVLDTSGSYANDWPEGAGVHLLTPDGAGNYSEWVASGAATGWEAVDDLNFFGVPDGDTTHIYSGTVDERSSVTLSDLSTPGQVLGVQILSRLANEVSGSDALAPFLRIGGTDYDQGSVIPTTAYAWDLVILESSPATAAQWTQTEVNGMELGWVIQ